MSALSDIRDKPFESWTAMEKCIVECWEMQGLEWMAEQAAAELAALTQRLEAAEAERDALMTLKEAAISWRGWWVDEKDEREAKEEKCGCPVCELILAVDFIKGDA